jgi:hypothetical protein
MPLVEPVTIATLPFSMHLLPSQARLFRDGAVGLFAAIIAQFRDQCQLAQILCRGALGAN